MKTSVVCAIGVLAILGFLFCSTPALAAEELTVKADGVEFKLDKNGKEYGIIRFSMERNTGKLKYTDSVIAVVPSWQADALKVLKSVKPGQQITMAGNWNTFNGSDSFKVKAVGIDKPASAKTN
jgi:hypothetical protein